MVQKSVKNKFHIWNPQKTNQTKGRRCTLLTLIRRLWAPLKTACPGPRKTWHQHYWIGNCTQVDLPFDGLYRHSGRVRWQPTSRPRRRRSRFCPAFSSNNSTSRPGRRRNTARTPPGQTSSWTRSRTRIRRSRTSCDSGWLAKDPQGGAQHADRMFRGRKTVGSTTRGRP